MGLFSRSAVSALAVAALAGAAFAQPTNDDCFDAIDISSQTFPFLTAPEDISLVNPISELAMCGAGAYTIWYKVTPTLSGLMTISTCAIDAPSCTVGDTAVAVYSASDGTCNSPVQVACIDHSCGLRQSIPINATAGTTYYVQAGKFGSAAPPAGAQMQLLFTAPTPPPADRWVEAGEAGDLPVTADIPFGEGTLGSIQGNLGVGDADMYRIEICDQFGFSATTVGGTTVDTQLFLFDEFGNPVTFNDDSVGLQSTITSAFIPSTGIYYLAVSQWDKDPLDSDGLEFWMDTPYGVERTPDGPGFGTIQSWSSTTGAGGPYIINLLGTCFPGGGGGGCPSCAADFNEDGGVDGADVEAFYIVWESGEGCGDVNEDGGVDGGDIEYFFVLWEQGGC